MKVLTLFLCILVLSLATAHPHHHTKHQNKHGKHDHVASRVTLYDENMGMDANDLFFPPLPGQSSVDFHPILRKQPLEGEPLTYYSWHIHSYFFQENKNSTTRMLAFRQTFIDTFKVPNCTGGCFMGGIFDNCTQGMCVWDPVYGVDGPHPYGQWGVYLPNEMLPQTIAWMSANHGEFDVVFHPNTGEMVGDHDQNRRAVWLKQMVPLDLEFLVWLQCRWFGCNDN